MTIISAFLLLDSKLRLPPPLIQAVVGTQKNHTVAMIAGVQPIVPMARKQRLRHLR